MMSVLEYALDMDKTVEEILEKCKELNINVTNEEDMLDEEAITELDNVIANDSYDDEENIIDEIEDELIEKEKNKIEEIVNNSKPKKQFSTKVSKNSKKELARKKKEMFNIDLSEINREFHFQRATIMTWNESDGEDDDTAISFQEKEGFIEIIRSIFLCEGKNIKMENLLDDNYLEVSLQNLPNLAKIINPEMSEMKLNDFITDLKNNNYELIIKLGEI